MASYDRNHLAFKDIQSFQDWMDENQIAWRAGRGKHQVMQIRAKDDWLAVSVSERNAVSTAPCFREMISRFNKGMPYRGAPKSEFSHAKEHIDMDLLDDMAMCAMQGMLMKSAGVWSPAGIAHDAYSMAEAMLNARRKYSE